MTNTNYIDVTEPIIITLPDALTDNLKFYTIKIDHAEVIDMDKFAITGKRPTGVKSNERSE